MTALNWITTEAKKLRKQYPKRFATWREYVAQASAIYAGKHKGKSPVGKKRKVGAVKKSAKKSPAKSEYHKDTKSHNVRISVVSGIKQDFLKEILSVEKLIHEQKEILKRLQVSYKKSKSKENRQLIMMDIKNLKNNFIPHNEKYLKSLQSALKRSI